MDVFKFILHSNFKLLAQAFKRWGESEKILNYCGKSAKPIAKAAKTVKHGPGGKPKQVVAQGTMKG